MKSLLGLKDVQLVAALKTLASPFEAATERELIALAYGHADKQVNKAALALVTKHVKTAPAIKAALKGRLAGVPAHRVDDRIRKLKRADRGEIASSLVGVGVNAHGLAFVEDPAFTRSFAPSLLRAKTNELYLTETVKHEYLELDTIPDALFDALPSLRKKLAFDRLTLWGVPMSTLPERFVEFAPFLKHLVLGELDLAEIPDVVFECKLLETLEVSSAKLLRFNKRLSKLTKLKRLEVGGSKAMRTMPMEFCDVQSLEFLDISMSKYTRLPPELARLTKLTTLKFQDTPISKPPAELASLPLKLVNVRWSKTTPETAKALWPKAKIES